MSHFTHIDLQYRPNSYFWAREHGIPLVSDIKGAERRKLYEKALQAEVPELIDSELPRHVIVRLGYILRNTRNRAACGQNHNFLIFFYIHLLPNSNNWLKIQLLDA